MKEIQALLLAAGRGTRLYPLTVEWPKCLMPIKDRPLLEYWLCILSRNDINQVFVNIHHHRKKVESFLARDQFKSWVSGIYEPELLGTAGTIRENADYLKNRTVLLVHADNWCQCNFNRFLDYHRVYRPAGTVMTMMTFRTMSPETCGVVELDEKGIVQGFHEKVENPPGNLANGAVYLLEPEIIDWITKQKSATDFSTDVLPNFVGRIATWENTKIHRDIGVRQSLMSAQKDPQPELCWPETDNWLSVFQDNPIHDRLITEAI